MCLCWFIFVHFGKKMHTQGPFGRGEEEKGKEERNLKGEGGEEGKKIPSMAI